MIKYNSTEGALILQNSGSGAMFYLSWAIEIRLIEMTFVCADEKLAEQLRGFYEGGRFPPTPIKTFAFIA